MRNCLPYHPYRYTSGTARVFIIRDQSDRIIAAGELTLTGPTWRLGEVKAPDNHPPPANAKEVMHTIAQLYREAAEQSKPPGTPRNRVQRDRA